MRTLIAAVFLVVLTTQTHAEMPTRIVSVGGAVTEILFELGAEGRIVGNDTTSSYPPAANEMPKVGYMRALSTEGILSLEPDLIIMTEEAGPPPVIAQLQTTGVEILRLTAARSIDDITANVTKIATRLGLGDAGRNANALIERTRQKLTKAVAAMPTSPSVMFILNHGSGTPMVSGTGTAADAVIALAGGRNTVSGYKGYKPLTPEAAVDLQPDVILVTSEGLAAAGGAAAFRDMPGINMTKAAKQDRIIAMGALYLLGFGPRTPDAALELHRRLVTE